MTKQLYIDGQGRVTCDDLRCAGQTAVSTGMRYDLNGASIERVRWQDIREFSDLGLTLRCESCHAEQSLIVLT